MNLIQLLLLESLRNRNLHLDLQGSNKRILSIAHQDFMNYLRFHWKLTSQEMTQPQSTEEMRRYIHEKPEELREFIDVWCGIWLKKWGERVKLGTENEESKRLEKNNRQPRWVEPIWRRFKDRSGIEDIIVEALIRNGEICGTSILAEHLLKSELASRIARKNSSERLEDLLDITYKALTKVRHLSRSKGKTVFIILRKSQKVYRTDTQK